MKPVVGVMVVLVRNDHVLMICRAKEPDAGRWSLPAGKIETGETIYQTARRELEEETGISAEIGEVITAVDAIERDENGAIRFHFVIIAVSCHSPRGAISVGNDVSSVKWVSKAEIETLDLAIGFDIRAVLKASNF